VVDATFWFYLNSSFDHQIIPAGFDLRLRVRGGQTVGSYRHVPSNTFVASWFHVLATTRKKWLIAYFPPDCRRIEAMLFPFTEIERFPSVLRDAGCRVGSARLLRKMMTGLIPHYPSD
jgi:hypothetical protein